VPGPDRRTGFTLLELLVVLSVIALLVAVLLPALRQARQAQHRVCCMTHLHQWATAAIMYALDYDGYLPRRGQGVQPTTIIDRPSDWFNALPPLLGHKRFVDRVEAGQPPRPPERSLWICPVATDPGHTYFFAYAMNMMLSTWWADKPDRIDNVGPVHTMVFMADGPGTHCSTVPARAPYSPVARHLGQVNLAFLDGHVASFSGPYVGCGLGDPHHPHIRWVVPGTGWPEPGQP